MSKVKSVVVLLVLTLCCNALVGMTVHASTATDHPSSTEEPASTDPTQSSTEDIVEGEEVQAVDTSSPMLLLNSGTEHPVLGDESNFTVITDATANVQYLNGDTIDLQIGHSYYVEMFCINSTVLPAEADYSFNSKAAIPGSSIKVRFYMPAQVVANTTSQSLVASMRSTKASPATFQCSFSLTTAETCYLSIEEGSLSITNETVYVQSSCIKNLIGTSGLTLYGSIWPDEVKVVAFTMHVTAENPGSTIKSSRYYKTDVLDPTVTNATEADSITEDRVILIPELSVSRQALSNGLWCVIGVIAGCSMITIYIVATKHKRKKGKEIK